ncbi:MAG: DUF456 domain-containing protein [Rikenellaceae bacterium]
MDLLLSILALLFSLLGLLGAILPILPGPALGYIGLICAYLCDHSLITPTQMWIWAGVCIVVTIIDYILPAYMTKIFGGSRSGVVGATIGMLAGFVMFPPLGIIICPMFGAVLGEMIHDKSDVNRAFKVAVGSLLSFIVGSGLKLMVAIFMSMLFFSDITPLVKSWFNSL